MDKIIRQGIMMSAGLDPASQKEMRATLEQIFSEAGNKINFNTPENKKGIQALAHLMRDMFASVGKGDMFDFSKMIESPEKMFKEMGSAAKEFEGVWNDIVTRMGNNSLSSIFMKNQSELSVALDRMEKMSDKAKQRIVENMQAAFEPVKSKNVNSLLRSSAGFKSDFESGETWEKRTTGALRYLNVYQQIMTLTKNGMDIDKVGADELEILDNIKNIGPYTIKQLESVKPQLQASLQNIFNLSTGKPLIGLTDGGVIDINVAPKVIKALDVGDVLGGKTSLEVNVTPTIDPEFQDKLSKLWQLAQNKSAAKGTAGAKDAYNAYREQFNNIVEMFPEDKMTAVENRLERFIKLKNLTESTLGTAWRDLYGMSGGSLGGGGAGDGAGSGDASSTEIEALRKQLEAKDAELTEANRKREEAELAERIAQDNVIAERHFTDEAEEKADMYRRAMDSMQEEMDEKDRTIYDLREQLTGTSIDGADPLGYNVDTTSSQTDGATTEEVKNLEHIREAVSKITAEVKEKTQEFLNEQSAVKKVSESEVHALGDVEKKVAAIRVALSSVNTLLNNIKKGKDVGAGLSNISINVNHKNDSNVKPTKDAWALEDTLRNKTNELLGKIVTNTDTIKTNTKDVANDATLKQVLNAISTKMKTTPAASGQSYGNQSEAKPEVTKAGGNLLKMYERLGALGVQKNALDTNSAERKGIEEKIRLLKEEINKKLKLVTVDKQLVVEAQKKGAADQRAQMLTVGGRKSDAQSVKNEKAAVNDLLLAYERLGSLRAERDMLPKGVRRDELQKEIKSETSRLWKRSNRLGVDSAQTGEAADRGAHMVQMDQLIEKTKLLGRYERDIISMKQGSKAYNNAESRINELNTEIALIRKKITLTQEEKLELDALIKNNAELVQKKSEGKKDKAAAERIAKIEALKGQYAKLGEAQANAEYKSTNEAKERFSVLAQEIAEKKQSLQLTQQELDILRKVVAESYKKQSGVWDAGKKDKDEKKRLADEKKLAKKRAMTGKAGNAISRAENVWIDAEDIKNIAPNEVIEQIKELSKELDVLRVKQNDVNNATEISDKQSAELIEQTKIVNKLTDDLGPLISEYHKLSGVNVDEANSRISTLTDKSGLEQYKTTLQQYVREITNGKGQIKGFNAETRTLTYTVKTGKNEFTEYTAAVRHLDDQLVSVRGTTKRTETFLEATKRKMKEISSYISGMQTISKGFQWLKQGVQYVREIDLALTELKKVTDETEESYDKFLETAAKTADKVGSTIQKVVSSTADWARLGYSMEQAAKFAESTQILMNVSEFTDVSQATDTLISSVQAFGYTAETSMEVVDLLNTIGKQYCRGYIVIYSQADNYNGQKLGIVQTVERLCYKQYKMIKGGENMACVQCNRMNDAYRGLCKVCDYKKRNHEKVRDFLKNHLEWTECELDIILDHILYQKIDVVNSLEDILQDKTLSQIVDLIKTLHIGGRTPIKIELLCFTCGEKLVRPIGHFYKERIYCSLECRDKYKTNFLSGKNSPWYKRVITVCTNCGKEIEVIPFEYNLHNEYGESNNFCSRECYCEYRSKYYVGEKHPMFGRPVSEQNKQRIREQNVRLISEGKMPQTMTKPHTTIYNLLVENKIRCENEHPLKYHSIDIYLKDYNLMIEIMGDYWHGIPLKYQYDQLNKQQLKSVKQDKSKHTYTKKYCDIEILYLWERDINNRIDLCWNLIQQYINNCGVLDDYNSYNYDFTDDCLTLKENIIQPYFITQNPDRLQEVNSNINLEVVYPTPIMEGYNIQSALTI